MTAEIPGATRPRPAATLAFWRDFLIVGAIIVAALHFGQGFLIPLAIALLLFALLTSLIDRFTGLRIGGRTVPLWLVHVISLLVIVTGIAAILSILASQAQRITETIPRYEERFTSILAEIVTITGEDSAAALSTGR